MNCTCISERKLRIRSFFLKEKYNNFQKKVHKFHLQNSFDTFAEDRNFFSLRGCRNMLLSLKPTIIVCILHINLNETFYCLSATSYLIYTFNKSKETLRTKCVDCDSDCTLLWWINTIFFLSLLILWWKGSVAYIYDTIFRFFLDLINFTVTTIPNEIYIETLWIINVINIIYVIMHVKQHYIICIYITS